MKLILAILITVTVFMSCSVNREIQAEIVNAELVKIDTIYRYPNVREQLLTWKSQKNVEYISYASIFNVYTVGARMAVLITK
jgi:hypothetical protein